MKNIYKLEINNKDKILLDIKNLLDNLINNINLNCEWSENNLKDIELRKCFIRGVLRKSYLLDKLQKSIVFQIKELNQFKGFNFFTKFYPMIHLPYDKIESSNYYHFDQDDQNEIYTCWVPITKNNYRELSIFNYENIIIDFLKKFLSKVKITSFFSKKIKSNYGSFYIWSGKRLHKGNLNISKNYSGAIQMKISKKSLLKEKSVDWSNITENFYRNKKTENDQNYLHSFKNFCVLLEKIDTLDCKNIGNFKLLVSKLKKILSELHIKNKEEISFSISVFSQRMRSLLHKNKNLLFNYFCYDIVSVILGNSNPVSLYRIQNDLRIIYKEDISSEKYINIQNIEMLISENL